MKPIDCVAVLLFLIQFPLYVMACGKIAWELSGLMDLIDLYFEEKCNALRIR